MIFEHGQIAVVSVEQEKSVTQCYFTPLSFPAAKFSENVAFHLNTCTPWHWFINVIWKFGQKWFL